MTLNIKSPVVLKENLSRFSEILENLDALNTDLTTVFEEDADWDKVDLLLSKRSQLISEAIELEAVLAPVIQKKWVKKHPELVVGVRAIGDQIKKMIKVDSEIFDNVIKLRERLSTKMSEVNKGMAFLKQFGKQANLERVISKIY